MSMQLLLGIYGAIVSTCLGILTILKFFRERPKISVGVQPVISAASEGQDTHGVLARVKRGDDVIWQEFDIEIQVRNSGAQACQISGVFVETAIFINQIRPSGLPVVLDPNMSYVVRVQPEYFVPKILSDKDALETLPVESVGVLDGLGKKHCVSSETLALLLSACADLPIRTAVYRHKETGEAAVVLQAKDPSRLVLKPSAQTLRGSFSPASSIDDFQR